MLNDIRLLKTIEEVCSNPKKYTVNGIFSEVASFLEKEGKDAIDGEFYYHSVFTPFLKWLVEKNNYKIAINLKEFQKLYFLDEEALKFLPILYAEYIESL